MRSEITGLLVLFLLVLPRAAYTQVPGRLSASGTTSVIWGVLEKPAHPGFYPGVILLHGAAGWSPEYAEYAKVLAVSGFVVLALDYYAETGSAPIGSEEKLEKWPHWQAAVRAAVSYLSSLPEVSEKNIGLVGFSRGAFLAVSVASSLPEVGAVVDYFGGGGGGTDPLEREVRDFPPLLIIHGEADRIVPVKFAVRLQEAVIALGGEVELHLYPGVRHGFNMPGSPTYSEEAAADSFRRTVTFLKRRLIR